MPSSLCPGGQKRTAGRWDRPGPRWCSMTKAKLFAELQDMHLSAEKTSHYQNQQNLKQYLQCKLQAENPGGEMWLMGHWLLPSGLADGHNYLLSFAFSGSTSPTLVCMRITWRAVRSQTSGFHKFSTFGWLTKRESFVVDDSRGRRKKMNHGRETRIMACEFAKIDEVGAAVLDYGTR
ncbi:uncharacterized protein [Callorhinus ursinus]|uniref:uncharacterized protein isoform X2 n=2 Tax=Callorhinus ursinus TaxID=34884 RepID=UPI003CD002D0